MLAAGGLVRGALGAAGAQIISRHNFVIIPNLKGMRPGFLQNVAPIRQDCFADGVIVDHFFGGLEIEWIIPFAHQLAMPIIKADLELRMFGPDFTEIAFDILHGQLVEFGRGLPQVPAERIGIGTGQRLTGIPAATEIRDLIHQRDGPLNDIVADLRDDAVERDEAHVNDVRHPVDVGSIQGGLLRSRER